MSLSTCVCQSVANGPPHFRGNKGAASGFPFKSEIVWIYQCPEVRSLCLTENQIIVNCIVQNVIMIKKNSQGNLSKRRNDGIFPLIALFSFFTMHSTNVMISVFPRTPLIEMYHP